MMRGATGRTAFRDGSRTLVTAIAVAVSVSSAGGQSPLRHWTDAVDARFAASQPVIAYVLRVDPADTTGFDVTLDKRGARDTTLLAMAAHRNMTTAFGRDVERVANEVWAWGRAGLRTGDRVRSVNGAPTATPDAVRRTLRVRRALSQTA